MNPDSGKENLKREIGVRALTLAILNFTVGTGIFVIPAIIAENLGAAAMLTYIVCAILVFLIALCFAEVGSRTIISGGPYTYIEMAFGPFMGFLANNVYWFGAGILADAALGNAFADTLKYFFPMLGLPVYRVLFLLLAFGGLAFLNIRSLKYGVRFVEWSAFGKLIPLVILVLAGIHFISPENLKWSVSPTVGKVGTASLLLFYAFNGFEATLCNGGEIKNSRRTVPLGIILGISCVLILYMSIQWVTQGVLGASISSHRESPLAALAGIIFGPAGMVLIVITTSISMLGALGGSILSLPRILFAGGRDGILPKALARVHPRFSTPYIAILMYAFFGFLFSVMSNFKQLAVIASASILLIYLGVVLSVIKLRKKETEKKENTFRTPGGITIPLLAVCAILWLLSNLKKEEITGIFIYILIFSLIYLLTMPFGKKGDPGMNNNREET